MSDKDKNFELVTHPGEALSYLKEAAKTSSPTTFWRQKEGQTEGDLTYESKFIGFSEKDHLITLKIPSSVNNREFVRTHTKENMREFLFSVSLSRGHVFFRSQFIGPSPSGYTFSQPSKVYKVQRRGEYRYRIPKWDLKKVEMPNPQKPGEVVSRKMLDLSAGGMAFFIKPDEQEFYPSSTEIPGMSFKLKSKTIIVDGEVRHAQLITDKIRYVKVGIFFTRVSQNDKSLISQFVFDESRKFFSNLA